MTQQSDSEFTTIELPGNRTTAEIILLACRDAGLVCELLTADANGEDALFVSEERHRLLVRSQDAGKARGIVDLATPEARRSER